jgi:glycine dehydrogenase subunit 2
MADLIFSKHREGRKGYTLPANDVPVNVEKCLPEKFTRHQKLRIPECSELWCMRHYVELSHLNHFIEKGFYPLGSCTMKYNPKINETLVRNPGWFNLHPLQPEETAQGALQVMYELQRDLAEISGFANVTLQPVAGAHGEFTGLKIISAYHKAKGSSHKTKMIIPDSAHGTNPASAAMNGYDIIEIPSDEKGQVDLEKLRSLVDESVAGFMLTNPNTLGIFESQIEEISHIIHSVDGLMYMDGANFNAIMGLVKPGEIGFDVMHFNLHKSFATPHGGGGPGSGPVGVTKELVQFLPVPLVVKEGEVYQLDYSHQETSIGSLHSFWGNFAVNLRAYIYIRMLGAEGILNVAKNAIINANYLMRKLESFYYVPYNANCMHEFIATAKWQKEKNGVKTLDIAKRLLDKGFHAPTIYFPLIVAEAMMIEPTETESQEVLDSFIEAMIEIAKESEENPDMVKTAPHDTPIRRIDDTYAARNLNLRYTWE